MTGISMHDGKVVLHQADCRDVLRDLADNSIDSVVTDPPYALVSIQKRFGKPGSAPAKDVYGRGAAGFMGKQWDTGETAFSEEFWAEVLRVLKPGGHVVAFSGTRTYHRMAVAIEDAGFEIRDQLGWLYGSGFPKSHDVSKGIDKAAGATREKVRHKPRADTSGTMAGSTDTRPWIEASRERGYHEVDGPIPATEQPAQWQGWGTALKPAWEPLCLARKPLVGTVAENVLDHGTGAINIDGARIVGGNEHVLGRWPANIIHDGSDEVLAAFPNAPGQQGYVGPEHGERPSRGIYGDFGARPENHPRIELEKSAARFFYCAKASRADRDVGLEHMTCRPPGGMSGRHDGSMGSITMRANTHPTVKPTTLMQWLCRLITPPGGIVLDPFMGSGSTGKAAVLEGFRFIGCEREDEYMPIATSRIAWAIGAKAANDNFETDLFTRAA